MDLVFLTPENVSKNESVGPLVKSSAHHSTALKEGQFGLTQVKKQTHCRPAKALKIQGSRGSQISRQSAHESGKVVSLTHRPSLPPGNIPGTHCAAGRIMSMKNSNDTIGNRTRDLLNCTACATAYFTLEQAVNAQRGSRGIAVLIL